MSDADRPGVTLLAIDDDPKSLELIRDALSRDDLTILTSTDPATGLELALQRRPEIVLLDLVMPGIDGIGVLERILAAAPTTEVILITGHYSAESAVEAIRKGASDYLTKPLSIARLRERVGALIAEHRQRQRALQLDGELLKTCRFEGMVGRSPLMLEVFARIRRAAPHFKTALVTGATGTGKELVARALHKLGPAASARFAVCNSSAIVETLFESELFGHVKGAFTGATQDKVGLFEYAAGGTVFLDEIGDLPLATQTKLLRVLETREFQRVGSPAPRKTDVRVVAATNRDLREMVDKKEFREDLFYRLSMVEIKLPRLAERKEDLPLLERHFIERMAAEYGKPIRGIAPRVQISVGAVLLAGKRAGTGKRPRPCLHDVRRRYHRHAGPAGTFDSPRVSRQNRRRGPAAHGRSAQAACACGCWPRSTATRPKPRAFSGCTGPPSTA